MRSTLRSAAKWLFLGLLGMLLFGVGGEWFIHVAEDKGWYRNAGANWDRAMMALTSFFESVSSAVTSLPFLLATALVGGFVIAFNLDRFLKRQENPNPPAAQNSKETQARINAAIADAYQTLGMAIGAEQQVMYDFAVAGVEAFLVDLSRRNRFEIPKLHSDGTEAGTLRALCYLNALVPALQLNDDVEARKRAAEIVPQLNSKSAAQLRAELGLPRLAAEPAPSSPAVPIQRVIAGTMRPADRQLLGALAMLVVLGIAIVAWAG